MGIFPKSGRVVRDAAILRPEGCFQCYRPGVSVLFTGSTELTIDAKQRLAIPAKYRSQWNEGIDGKAWICVPWPEGMLLRLYPEGTFERIANLQNAGRETLMPSSDQAQLEAEFFSLAERVEPDSAGRLSLPKQHLELVGMPSEVVVIGVRDRLEVRGRDAWKPNLKERFQTMPRLAEKFTRTTNSGDGKR
ncbi:MAG: hypothetical protein KF691_12690 [Phycisphaeraceae bacterium]|nr:hypothetical protein [Phycisphaeraceae bacterium]